MEYTNQYVFEGAAYPNRHRLRARPSTAESTSQTASKTVACTDHRGYPFHRSLDGRADAATGRGYFTVVTATPGTTTPTMRGEEHGECTWSVGAVAGGGAGNAGCRPATSARR